MPAILVNDVSPVISYTATAGQTLFSVPFEFFAVQDIVVERAGVTLTYSPTPANNNQFSVIGANLEGGGSITLGSPGATLGDKIVIFRDIAIERLANYPETGPMAVRSLNAEQAKHIGMMQQLERDIGRSVTVPIGESSIDLPSAAERAEKILTFDAAGVPVTEFDIGLLTGSVISSGAAPAQNIEFTATAGQTVFNFVNAAIPTFVSVFLNGVKLPSTDFTHSGTTVTLLTPATVGDRVALEGFTQSAVLEALVALAQTTGASLVGYGAETVESALNRLGGLSHFQRLMQKIENGIEDANVVIAGDSTGNETSEWYYLFAQFVALQYPAWTVRHRLWNDGLATFDAATTIQTGSGSRTLTFWNGSISGSVSNRHAGANFAAVFVNTDPDLIFTSYGHNGGAPVLQQLDYYSGLLEKLDKVLPDVPVIVIGQNPTLADETMAPKVETFRAMAARRGYGFIDVHAAFKQDGRALSILLADSVHPSAVGSQLWADTVASSFVSSKGAYGGGATPESVLLASWSTIQDFSSWQRNNTSTPSKNLTNFETLGYSVNLASTTAAAAWIYEDATSSLDIISLRGKYVTFAVWMRIDPANPDSSGRLEVADNVGSSVAYPSIQDSGFILHTCTHYVSPSATYLRTYIYPTVEAVSGTVQVDRATLALGLVPVDIIPPRNITTRRLSLIGSNSDGIGVLINQASSAIGLRGLSDDDDNPATEWVSDYSADRAAFKGKTDASATTIVDKNGISAGDGTGALPLRIGFRFSTGWGCTGHFYPQTNNTYDLGGGGLDWRYVYSTTGFVVNSVQVVSAQGAAVADGVAAAAAPTQAEFNALVTQFNALLARCRAHGLIAT